MTAHELTDQQAEEFKAWMRSRDLPKVLPRQGSSGPLGDVFLPPETVDEMEAAINEAFERVEEEEPKAADDQQD